MTDGAVIQSLRLQSQVCASLGSPFSGAFLAAAIADIEVGGPAAELFAPWAGIDVQRHFAEATALRFLGAFHELALSGEEPSLSVHYPDGGQGGDAAAAWHAARSLIPGRWGRLTDFMSHEPQTNEVGRSGVLLLGFQHVARRFAQPLRCVELGASAGLNQIWDQFGYRMADVCFGDPGSPVQLRPEWRGEPPRLAAMPVVAERLACDRRPNDIRDAAVRRRLMAYIWPDQTERLQRLRGAIDMAVAADVRVTQADAADFVAREAAPRPGVATVVYHSVFWVYMPAETQARTRALIESHGAAASRDVPFAWVRLESDSEVGAGLMGLRATLWPGGEEKLLARSHPHGTWIEPEG